MSTKFLPHPSPPESSEEFQLEEQQARLLATLRNAGGAPVSYAELRDAGIEFPASVVSELELAGVEFHHCYVGEARGVVGVRLEPPRDQGAVSTPTNLDGKAAEQQLPAEPEGMTARERPRFITALIVGSSAALVWIANAARGARQAMRGRIRALPAAGRPLADRLHGRPLADRFPGRSRGLAGLGAIVLAMAVFAVVGLTAGGRRAHRTSAHHRPAPALNVATGGRRPHVARHPHPSQTSASGTVATTSTCSACTVRSSPSVERPLRRTRPFRVAPRPARPAPRVRPPAAAPRPRTPAHQTPSGRHHHAGTTTPSDQQTKTTGGTEPSQP